MHRNCILPIRLTRDELNTARAVVRLTDRADEARAEGRITLATGLTLAALAVLAGEIQPTSVVPVSA